jgi:hypothetical protein
VAASRATGRWQPKHTRSRAPSRAPQYEHRRTSLTIPTPDHVPAMEALRKRYGSKYLAFYDGRGRTALVAQNNVINSL